MKGYEIVRFAVLVIAISLMDSFPSGAQGKFATSSGRLICLTNRDNSIMPKKSSASVRQRRRNRLYGVVDDEGHPPFRRRGDDDGSGPSSFWLRNACHGGFVVVKDGNRVLAQHEGLDKYNSEVRLIKESCVGYGSRGLSDEIKTRLYSPSQDRYVCFNQHGKVRAVTPKRAERMGDLCAFHESPVPDPTLTRYGGHEEASVDVSIRSAHNPNWLLGFGPNPRRGRRRKGGVRVRHHGMVRTREGNRATLPRKMSQRRRPRGRRNCDFHFATAKYSREDVEKNLRKKWQGLVDHIANQLQLEEGKNRRKSITRTAASSVFPTSGESAGTGDDGSVVDGRRPIKLEISSLNNNTITNRVAKNEKSDSRRKKVPGKPKALRKLVKKYRRLKDPREKGKSYLYLHNRPRNVPVKKAPAASASLDGKLGPVGRSPFSRKR